MPIRRISPPQPQPPAAIEPDATETLSAPGPATSLPASTKHATTPEPLHSYEVGYGKPPTHTRFRPGQSGNPKGRPKAAKGLKAIAREVLTQKVAVRTARGETKMSKIEALVHKHVEQAMKGNAPAFASLLRLYVDAVPEATGGTSGTTPEEPTATDLAILEELRVLISGGGDT